MKIEFTGRGTDITDRIRVFAKSKIERLTKHLEDIHDVSVVLSVEKYRQRAEISFLSQKRKFNGTEETNDMFQSIDRAVDKLETQVRKHKEKQNTRKRNTTESIRLVPIEPVEAFDERSMDERVKIIRTSPILTPMSLEDAVAELDTLDQDFLLFRNSEADNGIQLVYRRSDSHIGFIEPSS